MLQKACICCAFVVIGLAAAPSARAGGYYYAGTGYYYELTTTVGTWDQEEAAAVAMGGHLASVTSQGEEDFLINTFVGTGPADQTQPLWIGLYDANFSPGNSNRDFQWTDGSPLTYTDWNASTGEPNNNGDNEWYVAFNFHYPSGPGPAGSWNDTYEGAGPFGTRLYYGIVEISANSVPEPTGLVMLGIGGIGLVVATGRRTRRNTPAN